MKKGVIALLVIVFFCNFGRVEYSALHPKAKVIQTDSSSKFMTENPQQMITKEVRNSEQESSESSDENNSWAKYIVVGVKLFFSTLLKLLVA